MNTKYNQLEFSCSNELGAETMISLPSFLGGEVNGRSHQTGLIRWQPIVPSKIGVHQLLPVLDNAFACQEIGEISGSPICEEEYQFNQSAWIHRIGMHSIFTSSLDLFIVANSTLYLYSTRVALLSRATTTL